MYILVAVLLFSMAFGLADKQCPMVYQSEDRRPNKSNLRIMQYNVEWLFLDYYKPADCPGEGCPWKNQAMSAEHMEHVSNVINKYEPDIINICEIEGCNELDALITRTSNEYKPYLIQGSDTSTGQNVGMLTKIDPIANITRTDNTYEYPIKESNCGSDDEGHTSVSKHFMTLFNWNDVKVAYFSLHLLAYPTNPDRCVRREAQAKIMEEEIIKRVNEGYEIIVIGDFNDYDEKNTDVNDSEPISQVLDIIRGEQNEVYDLTDLASKIPKEERYTNWWDKNNDCISTPDEFVMIDYVLLTEGLLNMVKNVSIYHGYSEKCDTLESDHYPVIVDFNL